MKFSVITPSYNQGRFLEETIQSVLGQSHQHAELIVVDGGSTDESVSIIKKYESQIKWWTSEKDRGQSHAINKGLAQATGDIITWINSDDILEPGALAFANDYFEKHPDVSIIHGKTILFGEGRKQQINGPENDLKPFEYLPYMRFPQPSSFIRRQVFERCNGVNEMLHYGMDFELVAKAVLLGNNPSLTQAGTILIKYAILQRGLVRLQVLNSAGQVKATLLNNTLDPNSYTFPFKASDYGLPPGNYIYRLETGGKRYSRQLRVMS